MTAPRLVVIGASLGGLSALQVLLRGLPADCDTPIVLVQHRAEAMSSGLARRLAKHTHLAVVEPDDKERIERGRLYVAPAGYHLLIDGDSFALSTEAPVNRARPSVDVLLESAADAYGPRAACVILTGASADGAAGARLLKDRGGMVIVQAPETAESSAMPRAAIEATDVDRVLRLEEIGPFLGRVLCPGASPA